MVLQHLLKMRLLCWLVSVSKGCQAGMSSHSSCRDNYPQGAGNLPPTTTETLQYEIPSAACWQKLLQPPRGLHHFKEKNFSYRPLKCKHIVTKINSAKQRPAAVSKPCSAWAAQAAGRKSSRNLIVSPGESICISLEEGNKAGGHPSSFCPGENSTGLFYRSQQSPADTKCWQLWGSSSSWSAVLRSLGMGGMDLAACFGNSSQEGTDTTYSK